MTSCTKFYMIEIFGYSQNARERDIPTISFHVLIQIHSNPPIGSFRTYVFGCLERGVKMTPLLEYLKQPRRLGSQCIVKLTHCVLGYRPSQHWVTEVSVYTLFSINSSVHCPPYCFIPSLSVRHVTFPNKNSFSNQQKGHGDISAEFIHAFKRTLYSQRLSSQQTNNSSDTKMLTVSARMTLPPLPEFELNCHAGLKQKPVKWH